MVHQMIEHAATRGRIQGGDQGARAPPLISRMIIFQLNNFL